MRLTILGVWAPYPRAGGACPAYLVEEGETSILLDCGNGSLGKLLQVLDFRKLSAVVITHFHPDHYYDLFCLRHAIWGSQRDGSRREALPLYLPSRPEGQFQDLARFAGTFELHPIEGLPLAGSDQPAGLTGQSLWQGTQGRGMPPASGQSNPTLYEASIGPLSLVFCRTNHPLPTYAVAVKRGPQRIVYSADTGWSEELVSFAAGADLFLCEASLQEKDREHTKVGHLIARQAGELGRLAGVRRLVLTHFWPEYDLQVTREEASQAFGGPVDLAQEGAIYVI